MSLLPRNELSGLMEIRREYTFSEASVVIQAELANTGQRVLGHSHWLHGNFLLKVFVLRLLSITKLE